jgi:methyl-accepting chemotaxis protein
MARIPNRRRAQSLLQDRRVQLIHALLIVTYLSVYTLLLSAAALAPTILALQGDAEGATLSNAAELFLFEDRVWPLALLLILACGIHSIFMSHRVFGPLVRVYREATLVGQGDLTRRLRFRRNDHLLELRDTLNEMIDRLDRQMSEVHVARARCRHRLEELEGGVGDTELRARFEHLTQDFAHLEETLAAFKTSQGFERLKTRATELTQPTDATAAEPAEGQDRWDSRGNDRAASA